MQQRFLPILAVAEAKCFFLPLKRAGPSGPVSKDAGVPGGRGVSLAGTFERADECLVGILGLGLCLLGLAGLRYCRL